MMALSSRALRSLCCGLSLLLTSGIVSEAQPNRQIAAAPGAGAAQGPPNALQGFSQNRDQPVHINSRSLEVQDKKKMATFLGGVHLTQGDTTLTCQTLIVYYDQSMSGTGGGGMVQAAPGGAGGQQIRKLIAKGDVVVSQKDQTATGRQGVFEMRTNTVTLEGNVVVTQGPNVVRGERLTVDLNTGVSHVEAARGNGRVEGLFLPGSQHVPEAATGAPASPAPKP
jgi:lipopolysaccharide export system protein LptA